LSGKSWRGLKLLLGFWISAIPAEMTYNRFIKRLKLMANQVG